VEALLLPEDEVPADEVPAEALLSMDAAPWDPEAFELAELDPVLIYGVTIEAESG
jgi:hypothetical protein